MNAPSLRAAAVTNNSYTQDISLIKIIETLRAFPHDTQHWLVNYQLNVIINFAEIKY